MYYVMHDVISLGTGRLNVMELPFFFMILLSVGGVGLHVCACDTLGVL